MDALIGKLDDPYTDYLSPAELKALRDRTDRAYYGVGLQVAQRDEDVVVVRVYDGSPAAEQGVKAGDRIVSVNGKTAEGRTLDAVVGEIRGDGGHAGDASGVQTGDEAPRELTMTRARIRVPAVDSRIVTRDGRKIGYIALAQFSRGATRGAARHHHQPARAGRPGARARPARRPGRPGRRGRRHRRRVPAEGLDRRGDPGASTRPARSSAPTPSPVAGDLPAGGAGQPQLAPAPARSWPGHCATASAARSWASGRSGRRWCRAPSCSATAAR